MTCVAGVELVRHTLPPRQPRRLPVLVHQLPGPTYTSTSPIFSTILPILWSFVTETTRNSSSKKCDGWTGVRRPCQAPQLVLADGLLQYRLGGEVERRRGALGTVQPVAHGLPHRVLVVLQAPAGRVGGLTVLGVFGTGVFDTTTEPCIKHILTGVKWAM